YAEASFWPLTYAYVTASGRFGGAPDEAAMAAARGRIGNALNYIDNTLGEHPYISGDRFTGADIALYWNLMIGKFLQAIDDSETTNVQAYAARMQERPACRKALEMPEGWVNQPPGSVVTPPIRRVSAG